MLLFRVGIVLLSVMYFWVWDIHHICCVGQTWLSNSSRVKSSFTIPFLSLFPLPFHTQKEEIQKQRHQMCRCFCRYHKMVTKKLYHPSVLWQSSKHIQNPTQNPQPPAILQIQKPTRLDCGTRMHNHTHTHPEPRAHIFLWAPLLWPQTRFQTSEDVYGIHMRVFIQTQ